MNPLSRMLAVLPSLPEGDPPAGRKGRGVQTATRCWLAVATTAIPCSATLAQGPPERYGHSEHGAAFDSGMRQKPWRMEGIGNAPFPITTKNPEVQQWYDQANALLHSFWFEEAERTFRWCHKLEPENAMVYWGLARCGMNWLSLRLRFIQKNPSWQRYRDFLEEAVKRKEGLPERERLYIEAWDAVFARKEDEQEATLVRKLQEICLKYPDDVEAKAAHAPSPRARSRGRMSTRRSDLGEAQPPRWQAQARRTAARGA